MGAGTCGVDVVRSQRIPASHFQDSVEGFDEGNEVEINGNIANEGRSSSLRKRSGGKTAKTFSAKDVSQHSQAGDAWLIIRNKVYDVSKFSDSHPGGKVILTYAGKDATDVFAAFHEANTWLLLSKFCIGDLETAAPTPELINDFRNLRMQMQKEKLFESSKLFYVYKFIFTMSILALSLWMVTQSSGKTMVIASGIMLGLFWQQCGWLAHDFAHHQVFKQRWLNNITSAFLGNICQGFSLAWWKAKHNTHHAAPNECDDEYKIVDPDIDTLPLLAWSKEILDTVKPNDSIRGLLRWQAHLFFPMLLFARFAWLHSSWIYAFYEPNMSLTSKVVERSTLLLHYVWVAAAAFAILPVPSAILWLLASEITSGLFLGIVFVQSHNGMEVYNDTKDFYTSQIVSTRNVLDGAFNSWFTGGLNRQIEHHLFPTLPRHSLPKVSKLVENLCVKHGLVYEDVDMVTGTRLVLKRLSEVAALA